MQRTVQYLFLFCNVFYKIKENCDFCLDIAGQNGDRHCKVLFYLYLGVIRLRLRLEPVTVVLCRAGEKQML